MKSTNKERNYCYAVATKQKDGSWYPWQIVPGIFWDKKTVIIQWKKHYSTPVPNQKDWKIKRFELVPVRTS